MQYKNHSVFRLSVTLFLLCLAISGCSSKSTATPNISTTPSYDSNTDAPSVISKTAGTRGSTPLFYLGCADGIESYGNDTVTIDASHKDEGYIMVSYTGTNSKPKLQLTMPEGVTYTYNLSGGYEVFPLTGGNGTYLIQVFENMEGTAYSTLYTQSLDVVLSDALKPYLYANQYVNFTKDSKVAALGAELAYSANNDLEVVQEIYNYIISHFTYDYDKAQTVAKGYLPIVDEILLSQTGICFDYAAVMATMLRTQNIPTRLEVGYIEDTYHAWISVYIKEHGWINGMIEFDGLDWKLMDPTFASTSKEPLDFLTDANKYQTKYVY